MKEAYLHYIWKTKSFDHNNLSTLSGQSITIFDYGMHNQNEGGPDFLFAKLLIDDILFYGHIEIHVNGKEWFAHQHQTDPAYNNVVLHVVLKGGENGPAHLPTLELASRLNYTSYEQWGKMNKDHSSYPCHYYMDQVPEFIGESVLFNAFLQRIDRKLKSYEVDYGNVDELQLLKILCAKTLGASVNGEAFVQIVQRNLHADSEGSFSSEKVSLKAKGLRPGSHPKRRMLQLRWLFDNWKYMLFELEQISNYKAFRKYWLERLNENCPIPFTTFLADQLFINAIFPVMYKRAEEEGRDDKLQSIIHLYQQIPAEKNSITDKWNQQLFPISNAIHSQGVIEWTRYSCARRQCLNCAIGHKALHP